MSLPWFRKNTNTRDNAKIRRLVAQRNGWHAYGVWDFAIGYSNDQGTDGLIERHILPTILGTPRIAAQLVEARLWEEHPDGWLIHDFADYNPTRAEVESKRLDKKIAGLKSQCIQRHPEGCNCWKEKADALNTKG